ncbi:MAG TPA: hypothetical protein VKA02_05005 [Candidatus Acidoferrum sp.]|nr:hypothetical protein [Candidatus Acidoferrum sp.]
MLLSFLLFAQCLLAPAFLASKQGRPIPPGVREADKQTNAPVEAPEEAKRKGADLAKFKQEADELAKLSAGIPAQIALVNHGQLPKDLGDQLKRIEKLAKHLRSEVLP